MHSDKIDVITIGRSSIDLYAQQIGCRLEDTSSFNKAVGGCPANIAIGTARLGLKSAIITRVGNDHFGNFIIEQMQRENVNTTGIYQDPDRLTALAILGIRDSEQFPLLFYRTDCADSALCEADIHANFIKQAKAIVVTGTHFAQPHNEQAQRLAMKIMHENNGKVIIDIDYRPNLWGVAAIGDGEARYVKAKQVTEKLLTILPECDLIIGTEEELHIASGYEDTLQAIKHIRTIAPTATIVCKRGPKGCVVFDSDIPDHLDKGIQGKGFSVTVCNTLGAGDAFMSGFLRGWLRHEPIDVCCTYANACGAFAVSRLLCSPEYPTFTELSHFLKENNQHHDIQQDQTLTHLHQATTRRPQTFPIMALACDHRLQLEEMTDQYGISRNKISEFKLLTVKAAAQIAKKRAGFGIFMDGRYGQEALFLASHENLWISRPIEYPASRPLDFDGKGSLGAQILSWPAQHVVKCLCFYHPEDSAELKERQIRELQRAYDACQRLQREFLLEIIAGKNGPLTSNTIATALQELYDAGLKPAWWKLEPQNDQNAWAAINAVIEQNDPLCRGVVVLGLDAPIDTITTAFQAAAKTPYVKGFAVGRTIFGEPARQWLTNQINDEQAIQKMADIFQKLVDAWHHASQSTAI
ncbi:bifunctional 5-dehydro-2-deoxygluconokinase/5-dehydro-2-deoxyphosphogluconate aldolase [Commensalibacter oyaizuii]|uniref:5-dehydro-2-deoxygluconokinase n=1 Tax=Commensalibacter oyaizuii TaxID=3043873 RepID=A0ABT6Q2Q7_9PROT|nr:5-dehydro-2-deoxygluconokinase [Commensalibacter sp. TBRC 16381]MDI2091380.1 5-dehydro-2-deoxygluconokinase [Commensalibacter sp. TBRC 16381]